LLHAGEEPFQLRVIDFELAQPISQRSRDAATGSVHFMAPEQFENQPLDGCTDIYALGCVLHFAATGECPFSGDTNAQVITAHLRHMREFLAPRRPDLPDEVVEWLARLISRDPAQRPANAATALATLPA
ncbi:MAG TPA: protein kinase, partial [Prosthecobacter sp.]|nr:protein kinase [Prosthecobacter sp.]